MARSIKRIKRTEPIQLNHEERYIAYLDILGFREMLASQNFETDAASIVTALQQRIDYDGKVFPQLRYLAVSDTIVIAAHQGQGLLLCRRIAQVQTALLKLGFAIRGGVSFGEVLTHTTDQGWNIFGNTFVEAYQAEQNLAIYPRVAVDERCAKLLREDVRTNSARKISTYILRDADGVQFVNQFSSELIGLRSRVSNRMAARANREMYRRAIVAAIEATKSEPRANMKWRWLNKQLVNQLDDKG